MSPNDVLIWTGVVAFVAATVISFLHLLGIKQIPKPWDKWIIGTFLAGILTSGLVGYKKLIENPTPTPTLAPCPSPDPNLFSEYDPKLFDRLVSQIPIQDQNESDIDWLFRVRKATENNPLLHKLVEASEAKSSPFVSRAIQVKIGVPDQGTPDDRTANVSDKRLDNQILAIYNNAQPPCRIIVRARANIPPEMVTGQLPLIQLSASNATSLFKTIETTTEGFAVLLTADEFTKRGQKFCNSMQP